MKRGKKYTALDPSENKCEQKHAHKKSVKLPKVLLNLNAVLLKNAREVPRLKSRAKTCIQARPGGTDLSSYIESRGQSGTHEILSLKTKHKLKPVDPDQGAKLALSSFSSVYRSEGHRFHRIVGTLGNVA